MTKRAGKKKARRKPADTLIEDNLPPSASMALEKRALDSGWLMNGGEATDKLRQALLAKMARIALKSSDDRTAVSAFRAVTMAELRQQSLDNPKLPAQVAVGVNVEVAEKPKPEKRNLDIVQELLGRADVIAAVTGEKAQK